MQGFCSTTWTFFLLHLFNHRTLAKCLLAWVIFHLIYVPWCVCVRTRMHVCVCMHMHVRVCTCVCTVCARACMHVCVCVCVCYLLSHALLCNPTYYSPPGSSVYGASQARILDWVAIPFSSGSSRTCISCIGRRILFH